MPRVSNPLPLTPDNLSRQIDPSAERRYTLSVGRSRRAVAWDTVRMTWRELMERLFIQGRKQSLIRLYHIPIRMCGQRGSVKVMSSRRTESICIS